MSDPAVPRSDEPREDGLRALRAAATILANDAAAVVINPARFRDSAEQQHELGVAVAKVRAALAASPPASPAGDGPALKLLYAMTQSDQRRPIGDWIGAMNTAIEREGERSAPAGDGLLREAAERLLTETDVWFAGGNYTFLDRARFDSARDALRAALASPADQDG